ncbi:unnamed protein product, partial [Mesorhabditis belari]|uniref:Uncharacterized protein n=1 Tax=Mesorhabditis belari TaxID=2138241 RepID=A0AAF3EG14_9BILA
MLFVGALDPWKVLFIPLECLSSIVLFCGLVIEAKNSLLPFLFIQGFKIFVIGNNLYQGIEGMFDWGSEKMMEARRELESAGSPDFDDRKLARIHYGIWLAANYGTAIICYLFFFYIVWRCRRYFADLAHVLSADEQQEVEKGKDNEAIA